MAYNIQNDFGLEEPGFALLREVAQRYCLEELQQERKAVLPDEVLNLAAIELLTPPLAPPLQGRGAPAGSGVAQPLPSSLGSQSAQPLPAPQGEGLGVGSVIPRNDGFGIGIPETQKLRDLHYEEADTLNSEQIKKDFPVLHLKVNGHDLVWLDNGATTQKPIQVID